MPNRKAILVFVLLLSSAAFAQTFVGQACYPAEGCGQDHCHPRCRAD